MDEDRDALVGLRFEVSGGLGRMSGRIEGKAGALYLVQKEGAQHMELLSLDDLRPAKFYLDPPQVAEPQDPPEAQKPAAASAPAEQHKPGRRLSDQIRRHLARAK